MTSLHRCLSAAAAPAFVLLAAGPAGAHTLGAAGATFATGLAHPFGGLDHVLAMAAVGIWAAQLGARARWALPLAFMGAMALGGVIGLSGAGPTFVELGIVASVVVLGLAIALSLRPSLAIGLAVVALFALLHGHAHGAEAPAAATPLLYALGFLVATGMLLLAGLAIGTAAERLQAAANRLAGAAIAILGVALGAFLP